MDPAKESFSRLGSSPGLLYGLANFAFVTFVLVAGARGSASDVSPLYVVLLFAMCSTPFLVVRQLNDRYACYSVFLACYFVTFGLRDFISLLADKQTERWEEGVLSESELVILAAAFAFCVGYLKSASSARTEERQALMDDWPPMTWTVVGLAMWLGGTAALLYWNLKLTVRSGDFRNDTSALVTTLLMIGRYAQPLGFMILTYAYIRARSTFLMLLTIALVCLQVVIGFVSNTKEGAMIGGILVILTTVLVRARVPKVWLVASALFVVFAFPVFQAYRIFVVGYHDMTNAQASQNIGKALRLALDNEKLLDGRYGALEDYNPQSFFDRASAKGSLELMVQRTGHGVPYQHGYTLLPLLLVFIPRLVWADKTDVQTGQLVNKDFHVTGEDVTYISPSHIGDMYWNFGWLGSTFGMLGLGWMLGYINRRCDLSRGVSISRVLILAVTMYGLCARMEGAIASEYAVWIRSVVGVIILHWVLARRTPGAETIPVHAVAAPVGSAPIQFPNLLR